MSGTFFSGPLKGTWTKFGGLELAPRAIFGAMTAEAAQEPVRLPAEWEPQDAVWTAWPQLEEEWPHAFERARDEVQALCRALSGAATTHLLVPGSLDEVRRASLVQTGARLHTIAYGDIWLRDSGPIFVETQGELLGQCAGFNGWGGRYLFEGDEDLSLRIAKLADVKAQRLNFILEGGAIETDGQGTLLTTRQCVLNPNRGEGLSEAVFERRMREHYGIEKVLWLDDGMLNDHTDGHIDTVARYVAPGHVVCMRATGPEDLNGDIFDTIERELRGMTDAKGRSLRVTTIPSTGAVHNEEGDLLAVSYVNFVLCNGRMVVPTYGLPQDAEVLSTLREALPQYQVVGSPCSAIATGGGGLHCITKQQPVAPSVSDTRATHAE